MCRTLAVVCAMLAVPLSASAQSQQQTPTFKTGVERIVVDVQVVDRDGRPIDSLKASDFDVRIDEQKRPVASAQFLRSVALDSIASGAAPTAAAATPETATVETPGPGRDFILAVDESSFATRYAPAAVRAARGFVERLAPNDRVGIFTYPVAPRSFTMTTDHGAVLQDLGHIVGTLDPPMSRFHLSKSEVIDIEAGDNDVVRRVAMRECSRDEQSTCLALIRAESHGMAMAFESQVATSMAGLRTLFTALQQDPQRKTVVVVSGGLLASDRLGGRPDVNSIIATLGEQAARSNATLYVLHMDSSFLDAFSSASGAAAPTSLMRDMSTSETGLDRLAGTAGGTLIHVEPGREDAAFQRILRETSAYYLLSVEPTEKDRDGRAHYISVKVHIHGADVRSRRTVVIPARRQP